MKSVLLFITALSISYSGFAQYATPPDYFREVGIYVGIAPFTNPTHTEYTGKDKKLPYTVSANYYYNFTEHFQAGIDLGMTKWEATGSRDNFNGPFGQTNPGSRDTKYTYADKAWSLTARANYVIPTYDNYHINRANLYIGLAAGCIFTVNDGGITYAQNKELPGEENRYMSEFRYEAGAGYTMGFQVGYSYYIGNRVGINVEAAPRYAHMDYIDHRIASGNGGFDLFYFPVSVGLKFRF